MDVDSYKDDSRFKSVIEEKKLFFSDVYNNPADCTEEQVKFFLKEHIHEDDEVRLVLDGACCMDVRDKDDKWIRLRVTKGDMVVLPPGLYHRGLIDEYLQMLRMFENKELWVAVYRPAADDNIVHKKYLESRRAIEAN
ncbi:unnamed protein product [Owenia fusiformis]|nr:unnamed protein product [Owenia fusiformis]